MIDISSMTEKELRSELAEEKMNKISTQMRTMMLEYYDLIRSRFSSEDDRPRKNISFTLQFDPFTQEIILSSFSQEFYKK